MATEVKKVFEEKKFPSFIAGHSIFKSFKEVKKVFPEIGLENCEKEIEVDNSEEVKQSATGLLNCIENLITHRVQTMSKFVNKKADTLTKKREVKVNNNKKLLTDIANQLKKSKKNFIVSNNGRTTLNLPTDICDTEGKVVFKAGEGLFRVYNKLNENLREGKFVAMKKLDDFYEFKDFSSKNVPSLKYKLKFSSEGSEGLWDIATMSMRGISSCQSWGQGNSTHVVGSMVDPFTGIIYLTSGAKFSEHGSKMIRRCIVRFIVDEKRKVPMIGVERMYPAMEKAALDTFKNFIKEKTGNKFDVVYLPDTSRQSIYVPLSKVVSSLSPQDQPYRDSAMVYKEDEDTKIKNKTDLQTKLSTIYNAVAAKTVAAMRAIKIGDVSEKSKKAFKILRGTDVGSDYSYVLYDKIFESSHNFFKDKDHTKWNDTDSFLSETIPMFSCILKEEIIEGNIKKVRGMKDGIDDETLKLISEVSYERIDKFLNAEMKKLKPAKKEDRPTVSTFDIYKGVL